MTKDDEFAAAQAATAELEFAQSVNGLKPEEYVGRAHEIIKRYGDISRRLGSEAKAVPETSMLQYATPAEAVAAFRRGELDETGLRLHHRLFKQLRSQPK